MERRKKRRGREGKVDDFMKEKRRRKQGRKRSKEKIVKWIVNWREEKRKGG